MQATLGVDQQGNKCCKNHHRWLLNFQVQMVNVANNCPYQRWLPTSFFQFKYSTMGTPQTACDAHCAGNADRECMIEETISTVLTCLDMPTVLERTARLMRHYFGQTRIGLNLISKERPEEAEFLFVDDPQNPVPRPGATFSLEGTATKLAVQTKTPQIFENLDPQNPRVVEEMVLANYAYGSLACFPLIVDNKVIGTLDIAHPPRCGILKHCFQVAEKMAQLIAIALHNSVLMEEVRRLNQLLNRENTLLRVQIESARQGIDYIAESPLMKEVLKKVELVSPSDSTVLIRGETGTGKEGLARMVHELSMRKSGPFIVVNLGAIPETLIESELFGHEKGAFTGATKRQIGKFEQAQGGTLFLDEIGDAPLHMQVKLLRALQDRQITRLGGSAPIQVDVRLVAATNRPLEQLIAQEKFRSDFYYRINTFPIHLPPLRERLEDLRPLTLHLLKRHAARMHRRVPRISEVAWQTLEAYAWPGNIRELENLLQRALIISPGDILELPEAVALTHSPAVKSPSNLSPSAIQPFSQAVRSLLQNALVHSHGKIYGADGAAALLDLKPTTLQGKLKKYGVSVHGLKDSGKQS